MVLNRDSTVLGMAALDDVQVGDDLEAADTGVAIAGSRNRCPGAGRRSGSGPGARSPGGRNGCRWPAHRRLLEDLPRPARQRWPSADSSLKFLADVAMVLGAVGRWSCRVAADRPRRAVAHAGYRRPASAAARRPAASSRSGEIRLSSRMACAGLGGAPRNGLARHGPSRRTRGRGGSRARSGPDRRGERVGKERDAGGGPCRFPHVNERSRGVRRGGRWIHGGGLLGVRAPPPVPPAGNRALYPSCRIDE